MTIFLGLLKNKVGKCIKSIHICHLWVLMGFSAESEKNLWLGKFLNLELNTRLPTNTCKIRKLDVDATKKISKLEVDAFREEGKRLKSQIHIIIISRDC